MFKNQQIDQHACSPCAGQEQTERRTGYEQSENRLEQNLRCGSCGLGGWLRDDAADGRAVVGSRVQERAGQYSRAASLSKGSAGQYDYDGSAARKGVFCFPGH